MTVGERYERAEEADATALATELGSSRGSGARHRWVRIGLQIGLLALILGSWQFFTAIGLVNKLFASQPGAVASALYHGLANGSILQALKVTLFETIVGFVISAVAGIASALLLFSVPTLQEVVAPFISAFNSLPRLALTPLFIIWFGIGSMSKIALAVTFTYFIVVLNTYAGLKSCPRDYLILGRALGVSRFKLFRHFMLPAAAPSIFIGLELNLVYSFLAAVIGEMISGGNGIGASVASAQAGFDSAAVFADLFVMGIAAAILTAISRAIEHRVLAWHRYELRGTTSG